MLKPVLIGAVLVFGVSGLALAQPDVKTDVTRSAGQTTAGGSATVTATITAIDAPSRKVTLKTKTGKVEEMVVGEEARNFDQLKVGDVVTIEYREALTLSLKKGSGAATAHEKEIAERAPLGAKPGGVMGREVTVVAQVMAVNKEAQIVTVKGPKGQVVDLHVQDPAQMQGIAKGDRVQAVYTQAVAVSVVPGPGK